MIIEMTDDENSDKHICTNCVRAITKTGKNEEL